MENDSFLYRRVEVDYETEVKVHIDSVVKECARVWSIVLRCDGSHWEWRVLWGHARSHLPCVHKSLQGSLVLEET